MILCQQQNEDEDVDMVDKMAKEEELQVVTTVKQTGNQVIREHDPNLRLKLPHHGMQPIVPPQAQAQPIPIQQPQAQAAPLPPVPLAVGQSGHRPNAQLLMAR